MTPLASSRPCIFGEVLFDHFPNGARVLGGAPFNVAWHLQALGDRPRLLSRVGNDEPGREILRAMTDWGMDTTGVQCDPGHPTGRVVVEIDDDEPSYRIVADCAYDFIVAETLAPPDAGSLLYHGTLGLRHQSSRNALDRLLAAGESKVFLDVNLRAPWWRIDEVQEWLARACWVKLNREELHVLGFPGDDIERALAKFQERFSLAQAIVTLGAAGALVRTGDGGFHRVPPAPAPRFVDAVGAGDAFSAVYIHGLLAGWPVVETLDAAQKFAAQVVALRGATTTEPAFYRDIVTSIPALRRCEQTIT